MNQPVDSSVAVYEDETGTLVIGAEGAVREVLDEWATEWALGAISSLSSTDLARASIDVVQLGVRGVEVARRIAPRAGRARASSEVRLVSRDLATGRYVSSTLVETAFMSAGGPLGLQIAALQKAFELAVEDIKEAIAEVGEKVDELLRLASAERLGRALGQRRILQRRVEEVRSGATLSDTDWSSIASLGVALEVGVEQVRDYLRRKVSALDGDQSAGVRATALEKAVAEGKLVEELQLLAQAERSLFLWQCLRVERVQSAEPQHLPATMASATATLREHLQADRDLASQLALRLASFASVGPLQLHNLSASRKLRKNLVPLRQGLDDFIRARELETQEWTEPSAAGVKQALSEVRSMGQKTLRTGVAKVGGAGMAVSRRAEDWTQRHSDS